MSVHVAFLRAINVGNRRVSMDRLRTPLEKAGFEGVATFIASGNVAFEASDEIAALERRVEEALTDSLGFEVVAFVRTIAELGRVIAQNPFEGEDAAALTHVGFFKRPLPASRRAALEALSNETDALRARGKEVYWLARAGMGRATVSGADIEKITGRSTTLRSLKMLRRLHAKVASTGDPDPLASDRHERRKPRPVPPRSVGR